MSATLTLYRINDGESVGDGLNESNRALTTAINLNSGITAATKADLTMAEVGATVDDAEVYKIPAGGLLVIVISGAPTNLADLRVGIRWRTERI